MRDNLRVMGAWLASTLVWLPVFVPGLIALPSLTRYATHYPEDYLSPSAVWATISISMIMMIAGWLLMAIASQKRRGEEKITRIFAIVILAFLTIMGLSLDIGLAVLIGYVIGLTVVQHVAGRAARITLSWITMLYVAGIWKALFYGIILQPLQSIGILKSSASALAFSLTRYIWAGLVIILFQSLVKSFLFRELGKQQRPTGGLLLIIGYSGTLILTTWRVINSLQSFQY
jgi:hypothetical protein